MVVLLAEYRMFWPSKLEPAERDSKTKSIFVEHENKTKKKE